MNQAASDPAYIPSPAWLGAALLLAKRIICFVAPFVTGMLLALLADGLAFAVLFASPSAAIVFAGAMWVLVTLWLILFKKKWRTAIGFAVAVPLWPYVAYPIAMIAFGITC